MGFQLDTSGFVQGWVPPHGGRRGYVGPNHIAWSGLDPFTQGYVEAALTWTAERFAFEFERDRVRYAQFSDLAPETLARIVEDCAASIARRLPSTQEDVRQNRHQGRFLWEDRQKRKRTGFPPLTAYLGDDGKVYLREAA